MFGGGSLTNEKAYLMGKFARVALRTTQHRLLQAVLHVLGGCGFDQGVRDRPGNSLPRWKTPWERRPFC